MSLADVLTTLSDSDGSLPDSTLAELSELKPRELALLAQAWDSTAQQRRREVVSRLVELADSSIELNFHGIFRHCLSDDDAEVREEAVRGLWECEDGSLVDTFILLMEQDASEAVRAEAARALGRFALLTEYGAFAHGEYAHLTAGALLNVVRDTSRPVELRGAALEAVAPLSLSEVETVITDSYRDDDDRIRMSALRAMGASCDPSWLPALLRELYSSDSDMRREAAAALGEIEDEASVSQLAELVYDEDVEVRLATIRALGNIGSTEATECLKLCLDDPDEAVSRAAEEILDDLDDGEDMPSFLIQSDQA